MLQNSYTDLPPNFFSETHPDPLVKATLVAVNPYLKQQLQFDWDDERLLALTSGYVNIFNLKPVAQKYTGHQFGYYNPDLGDGRGVLLGQWIDGAKQAWDFHLKGAGVTPYSRRGDGRAVLRSVIREYLASEALYGLGVPTTRALAIASSDEPVQREIVEKRASLIRVSPTHIRFGHFQWAASKGKATLEILTDHVIKHHFPELTHQPKEEQATALLKTVCVKTAQLIAKWQSVGFNHGVMNTDNMSIMGETFDFGPFAFFDDFQIGFICNHSDTDGRYAYNQQPSIALWNCKVLALSLELLVSEDEQEAALNAFVETYNHHYLVEMNRKLGLHTQQADDKHLIGDLLILMDQYHVDFSLFFRRLAKLGQKDESELMALLSKPSAFSDWFERYRQRLVMEGIEETERQARILSSNPSIILRNYIAQEIIEAAEAGNDQPLTDWLKILHNPYAEYPDLKRYQEPPSSSQKGMALSCSS